MKKILIYLLFLSTSLNAQVANILVEIEKYTIDSKILETERNYWVSLPLNYDSSVAYPVMYVLDAEWKFSITNALEKDLSGNGKIPPHIVVGITHPNRRLDMTFSTTKVNSNGMEDTTMWNTQNTGNGLKFLGFIEDELIEEINRRYSTSGFNILIGHSLGGYFCSYILPIQKSFRSLQIYDPSIWYNDGEAIKQVDNNLSQSTNCIIYIASSGKFEDQVSNHHKKIEELLDTLNRFPNIHSAYKCYENEHHNSMYLYSFLDGMSMLYEGYELKMFGRDAIIDVFLLEEHFKVFSKTIQFEFTPQNHLYLEVGEINFYQKKYQNCIDALEMYLEKNPVDPYALELVGDAYTIIGKRKQGLKSYTKAYEISPDNPRLKGKIEN
jgi:predicted alpha/beta superfamily hydrolase